MTIKKIIEQVKPSVVYIICVVSGRIRLPKPSEKGLPTSRYLSSSVKIGGAGSGFIVDPEGYIITNGHVLFSFTHVNVEDDPYVKQQLFEEVAQEREIPLDYVVDYGVVEYARRNIFVQFGESISSLTVPRSAIPGRVVGIPSPASEKDVAVIKIDRTSLPSLDLGESKTISVGDRIYVVGYPGVVKDHPYLSEETGLEPTVTSGIISAKRKTKDGSACIQTDATIEHGNSGGPAINEKGAVIGIATFGSLGRRGTIQGYNFLRPSELVEEFLKETGVRNVKIDRSISDVLKRAQEIQQITLMIRDHGRYKIDDCKFNVGGYCNRWTWQAPKKWGVFKKDGKKYGLKASTEYCGLCDSFIQKGQVAPEKKIEAITTIMEANGKYKMDHCVHNDNGFCEWWIWDNEPIFYDLKRKKIKTRKQTDGKYHIEANKLYCSICSDYSKKTKEK